MPVLLRIGGMGVIVPDDLDAGGREVRLVEIGLRRIARDIPGRAKTVAKVDEALVATACNVELGRAVAWRRNAEFGGEPIDQREVKVDEARPRLLDDIA